MKELNFTENKVQVLTLDDLEKTYRENLTDGTPVGGIYHFELIHQVLDIFERQGLKPEVQEIFAANNRDSRRPGATVLKELAEKFGEHAVEAHLLRRVYANILIHDDETDHIVTCLAVAYHQKGIQLGIGPMVRVCHNQTILGAEDVIANYACYGQHSGATRVGIKEVLQQAQNWSENYGNQQEHRRQAMQQLASVPFAYEDMLRLIGRLVEQRIVHDTSNPKLHVGTPYPLSSCQINETAEQMLLMMDESEERSYWDAYQRLNTVLKPDRMDIPAVLPQSLALFETLNELAR